MPCSGNTEAAWYRSAPAADIGSVRWTSFVSDSAERLVDVSTIVGAGTEVISTMPARSCVTCRLGRWGRLKRGQGTYTIEVTGVLGSLLAIMVVGSAANK